MTTNTICTISGTEKRVGYKELIEEIYRIRPDFEGPLHTTNLSNFIKIMKSGVINSRMQMESNHISFADVADREVMAKTLSSIKEKVRFYYYFSTPTNYRASYTDPVIIVCEESLFDDEGACFSNGNAMSKNSIITSSCLQALKFDWKTIFSRGSICGDCWQKYEIVRKRNAEFLYPGSVPINRVKRIYFPSTNVLEKAYREIGNLLREYECVVDSAKFGR